MIAATKVRCRHAGEERGFVVKIVKPNNNDPILLQTSKSGIAIILIRFLVFLGLAVVVLMLAWLK